MTRYTSMIVALSLCILPTTQTQAQSEVDSAIDIKSGGLTITVTRLDVSDNNLKLRYEIRNESEQDIWILVGFEESGASAELFMDRDERTLLIRRRLDVPFSGGGDIVHGRYILMRTGETQTESVKLAIPVYPEYGFAVGQQRKKQGLKYATRLAIEIGYYASDLTAIIRRTLEEVDRIGYKIKSENDRVRLSYFKGLLSYNELSEMLRQRDEELFLPYTYQWFKGEQILRTVVEDVCIPYEEKNEDWWLRQRSLNIRPCTRVEIQYRPSMLEYFFPYVGQQSLLSPSEKQYLDSGKTIVVQDQQALKAFVNNINEGIRTGGIVRERTMAQVVCYHDEGPPTSFHIYNDYSVVKNLRARFTYEDGFPSLRTLTPQIRPFELRVQCAANLRNLWHRIRLYYKVDKKHRVDSSGKSEILYPAPSNWCAAIVQACRTIDMLNEDIIRPFICPAITESKSYLAKSHYAMNPNCKPDSPPDMVLLFETKTGWNQHGGPELFTFDNHDPKGGCVLLNDGTVKFIRTKEELEKLRWK